MKPLALLIVLMLAVVAAGCGSETEDYADALEDLLASHGDPGAPAG